VHTTARGETALAYTLWQGASPDQGGAVRPMRVQDREVKGEDRERRLLLAKIEPPDFAVGTWRRR